MPDHILEQIFNHLTITDLKKVLPLHSRFNGIVCNNSKINNRFTLTLNRHLLLRFPNMLEIFLHKFIKLSQPPSQNSKALLKSHRKFKKLQIFGDSFPIMDKTTSDANVITKIVKKFGEYVISCEITLRADMEFISSIMNILKNLKSLEFLQNSAESAKEFHSVKIPAFNKLQRLKLNFVSSKISDEYFILFSKLTTLRTFIIMGHKVKLNLKCLNDLLSRQLKLNHLVLQSYDAREFLTCFSSSSPFKLKRLEFSHYEMIEKRDLDHLESFLNLQHEINDLTIFLVATSYQSILQAIANLPNLQRLYLTLNFSNKLNLLPFRPKSNLKELRINFTNPNDLKEILDAFPSLKKLELVFYVALPYPLFFIKAIERVTFYIHGMYLRSYLYGIANLRELKLYNIQGSTEDWRKFFAFNSEITTIKMFQSNLNEDKIKAIIGNLKKLQVFICYDVLSADVIKIIKSNLPDLKKFYIWNDESSVEHPLSKNSTLYEYFY